MLAKCALCTPLNYDFFVTLLVGEVTLFSPGGSSPGHLEVTEGDTSGQICVRVGALGSGVALGCETTVTLSFIGITACEPHFLCVTSCMSHAVFTVHSFEGLLQ